MRRFPVDTLGAVGTRITLDAATSHHVLRVVRIARGEAMVVFDGAGHECQAVLIDVRDEEAIIEIRSEIRQACPQHALHLVLAILKGSAMDTAVRMATEAGATEIHPLLAQRSVARRGRMDRWSRIAEAAAQQCGRADLPTVHEAGELLEILTRFGEAFDRRVATLGGEVLGPAAGDAVVVVGPEGGLTPGEIDVLRKAGFTLMALGKWTLRADTAAAVAVARTAG